MTFGFIKKRVLGVVFTICLVTLSGAVPAQERERQMQSNENSRESRQDGRMRPPSAVTCDRNYLTAHTGKVVSYSRSSDRIKLTIHTDSETEETVVLIYPRRTGPWKWFLFEGKTFSGHNWKKFEVSRGKLYTGMRVSAWVCSDGRKPILDWQPSTGNVNPPLSTP